MRKYATVLIFLGLVFWDFEARAGAEVGLLRIQDVGVQSDRLPRVGVVISPGVRRDATLLWERSLEDAGFDAWRIDFHDTADSPAQIHQALRQLDREWEGRAYSLVAHGYAGRLVVDANPAARKLVLVGAPLGPQLVPTVAGFPADVPVLGGLPWPEGLLGDLPQRPLPAPIATAYLAYAQGVPASDPSASVLLMASGGDVVGPPECSRLPSIDWTDREFIRLDFFSHGTANHADLLKHRGAIRQMVRVLGED